MVVTIPYERKNSFRRWNATHEFKTKNPYDGSTLAVLAQFSLTTDRGRKTDVIIDFENRTVTVTNKLFKVDYGFSENRYFE